MKYARVITESKTRHTDCFYTYRTPDDVRVGDVVEVSFGKGERRVRGVVFGFVGSPDVEESRIKDISAVLDEFSLTEEIVETCVWMRQRYGIKYIDAVRCFLPKGRSARAGKVKDPLKEREPEEQNIEKLTAGQEKVLSEICGALDGAGQESFLLHGVTGSGKTEVYMRAIERTLEQGRSAIMLVPEIALTKQITERFIGRFGKERLAILHSRLTIRERYDEWQRIRNGSARVVIGARMAVFAPLEDIGLIVMDEEHEATYKADMSPKYETVDVALKRLIFHKGVLLMGSATPSVVSYQRAKEGIYRLLTLNERYNGAELPEVSLVDMREELKSGNRDIFSGRMYRELRDTLDRGEQAILFLNRRGYSTFVSCRECGKSLTCPECGISLTYHKADNACTCHYCGRKRPVPKTCPECGSKYIKYFGVGTEQVEERAKALFPGVAIDRLDLDSAKSTREIDRILSGFAKGSTRILIGTQLVAKGLDFRNVGLVGVMAADVSLNIPDYRATERTYQLVTQVAGRAGRGDRRGRVLVQTYDPENFALTSAAAGDYEGFFRQEIEYRRLMGYPPFSDIIAMEFTGKDDAEVREEAEHFYELISSRKGGGEIFAPKEARHFKGSRDSVRYYVLIKSPKGERNAYMQKLVHYVEARVGKGSGITYGADVNPYSSF
ncbi:MAG: primosomal protein N' [Firmicutes bacterium]|nr:primosomal protein N' [Bacillota bacterium]